MAHYAFLNENNIVTEVIVGVDENELIEGLDPETWYTNFRGQVCKRTSYNSKIRGNYAGIGMVYLIDEDIFINLKCHNEAVLDVKNSKWICNDISHVDRINELV